MLYESAQWSQFGDFLLKMVLAVALAVPIAWERELGGRVVGLRTFPLVALASCSYVLLFGEMVETDANEALARVLQGLMTGMGFIGGGAILKGENGIHGTATAASLWSTGALGAAVALGRFEIALLISVMNLAILLALARVKERLAPEEPERQLRS